MDDKDKKKKASKKPKSLKELFDLYITRKLEDEEFIIEFKIKRKKKKDKND